LIHTDRNNNDGMHCCLVCMRSAGHHGPKCAKALPPSFVFPTSPEILAGPVILPAIVVSEVATATATAAATVAEVAEVVEVAEVKTEVVEVAASE